MFGTNVDKIHYTLVATEHSSLCAFLLPFALGSQCHCRDKRFSPNSLLDNSVSYAVCICTCAHKHVPTHKIVGERPGELMLHLNIHPVYSVFQEEYRSLYDQMWSLFRGMYTSSLAETSK